ncbi:MAG: DUF4430 domain-containing protein [Oscillospiraceae bacterium]|nr:DUF4430 domain-containing protein [Oscillospiraceae bacterium]
MALCAAMAVLAAAFFLQPGEAISASAGTTQTLRQEQPAEMTEISETTIKAIATEAIKTTIAEDATETAKTTKAIKTTKTTTSTAAAKATTTAVPAWKTATTAPAAKAPASAKASATNFDYRYTLPAKPTQASPARTELPSASTATTAGTTGTTSAATTKAPLSCTISIRCDTILSNLSLFKKPADLIPSNGFILQSRTVAFTQGESVFDLLKRIAQSEKIHLEFTSVPAYQSVYIEGIGNIYEFDCGPLSGWMYRVNGVFPGYGSGRHTLRQGDTVEWLFTCDLGRDIGGEGISQRD